MIHFTEEQKLELLNEANKAMLRAYTPYSHFNVGAALLTEDGTIIHGCNIENASYGATNCAERTALFSALAQGNKPKSFKMLAVIGDTDEPITPCGICRQVIVELVEGNTPVILGNLKGQWKELTVSALLPDAFIPSFLIKEDTQ